jgi:hypothetical protein
MKNYSYCCWCDNQIEFKDYSPPDFCPNCDLELQWDWYDDPEGRPPSFFPVKSKSED